jgi:hypothetical protein
MNIPQKKLANDTKPPLFAGIDVGAKELILVIRKNNKLRNISVFSFALERYKVGLPLFGNPTLTEIAFPTLYLFTPHFCCVDVLPTQPTPLGNIAQN